MHYELNIGHGGTWDRWDVTEVEYDIFSDGIAYKLEGKQYILKTDGTVFIRDGNGEEKYQGKWKQKEENGKGFACL